MEQLYAVRDNYAKNQENYAKNQCYQHYVSSCIGAVRDKGSVDNTVVTGIASCMHVNIEYYT